MRGKWLRPQMTAERLFANTLPEPNSGCWLWTGSYNQFGYGRANLNGQRVVAHKASFILHRGPVPDGMELDHICRVRLCVNPSHLEPVTKLVNVRRGMSGIHHAEKQRAKQECPKGHPYSGTNLFTRRKTGYRECRECMRQRQRKA